MKPTSAIALFTVLVSAPTFGETFVGPTTSTNRLLVASNSAIIITATFGDFTNSTQVVLGGFQFTQSYFAPLENGNSYALAGPAELIFSNSVLITYYQLTNSAIRTQSIGNDPIGISIAPTGRCVSSACWRRSMRVSRVQATVLSPSLWNRTGLRNSLGREPWRSTAACFFPTASSFRISSRRTVLRCPTSGPSSGRAVVMPSR